MAEDIAVTNFRKYLRINTAHPTPDYETCKQFLLELGAQLNLERNVYECLPGKPIVILTHRGTNESLPSLLLNSHTDVVGACEVR
uniref:N-acyl-aliphatic-L-amino acid amidohydrolase n=1 Tax=Syphacia muris TaxID=451379 RepID=A0A0N5ACS5_9BILA